MRGLLARGAAGAAPPGRCRRSGSPWLSLPQSTPQPEECAIVERHLLHVGSCGGRTCGGASGMPRVGRACVGTTGELGNGGRGREEEGVKCVGCGVGMGCNSAEQKHEACLTMP